MFGMTKQLSQRFWIELALSVASAALVALTVLWNDWIELVFRIDPDAAAGALEWSIVAVALVLTMAFSIAARLEWRRARTPERLGS
jgi:hypothetical protein